MLYLMRVVGESMVPALRSGQIVVVLKRKQKVCLGDVVIVRHDRRDKIKRITGLHLDKIFIEGDNKLQSTDSRHFGWIDGSSIRGKVIWPKITTDTTQILASQEFPKKPYKSF
jgi:nickel-type superoxide dismutase maturation protease